MHEHLVLPRPLVLARTITWSLIESAGLPLGALVLGTALAGRDAGLLAGLGAAWLAAGIRKITTGCVPSLLTITLVVLTLQTVVAISTGQVWIFLAQFPLANLCMCYLFARTARGPNPLIAKLAAEMVALRPPPVHLPGLHRFFQKATWLWSVIFLATAVVLIALMMTEPVNVFMMLMTVATVALAAAGIGASALWFALVLRKLGITLRFA